MKHALANISRLLSAGTITHADALQKIRALKQAHAETNTLLATLQWEPWRRSKSTLPALAHRHILLCGLTQLHLESLEGKIPHTQWTVVGTTENAHPAEVYEQVAVAFFEAIQQAMQEKEEGPCLVQVIAEEDEQNRMLAGLAGLVATATLENPRILAQVVLVPSETAADQLVQFLTVWGPDFPRVVRWHKNGGEQQVWRIIDQKPIEATACNQTCPLKENGAYLLTGGLGGLGILIARDILTQVPGAAVLLVGRSQPAAAKMQVIESLGQDGSRVEYVQADVADAAQMENLFSSLMERYGQLNGIVHGAGVLHDGLILTKTAADFREVLRPKVAGAWHVDWASRNLPLDFFVLFSSIASWAGNVGQADYAAANGFLDQFAKYRNSLVSRGKRQGKTLSLSWPHWLEGGMHVDAASMARLQQRTGLRSLSTEQGLAVFYQSLCMPQSQLLVMHGKPKAMQRALAAAPTVEQKKERPVAKAGGTTAFLSQPGPASSDDHLAAQTRDFLRREFAIELKIPADRIEAKSPLEQYGIDSILAMNLTARLEQSFGTLPKTLFFEYQTLDELSDYFLRNQAEALQDLLKSAASIPTETGTIALEKNSKLGASGKSQAKQAGAGQQVARSGSRRNRRFPAGRFLLNRNLHSTPTKAIAIIGLSGRYPQARDLEAFWENLRDGRDCIEEIPAQRWDWRQYYTTDQEREGAHLSKWGGFIPGVDEFDPRFFNIAPREAHSIDPQERLFLQYAWQAVEDAGYTRDLLQTGHEGGWPGQVGVYVGVMYGEYNLSGSLASIANRVSYFLNVHGPSLTLDTMCSSSLTAIHLACQDLQLGRTDLALAGGVNVSIHPNKYTMLSRGQFISRDGHCRSFGMGGSGYIPGEGVGVALLKRLADAERDNDHIWGIIRGSALNHGGKTNGYTVPNPHAQAEVIKRAMTEAGIEPAQISYIEAHGTGTQLGDPIEIAALAKAFREGNRSDASAAGCCLIGSAKSNIGHCESAAGIAGISKVLLQMRHGCIVPSLHSSELNPHIDFSTTPFEVNQSFRPWPRPVIHDRIRPRIAGISSFGAGGSNAHVLIEEYQTADEAESAPNSPVLVPLSARTAGQLLQRVRDLLAFIERSEQPANLRSLAYTLQVGREAMEERAAFLTTSIEELRGQLSAYVTGQAGVWLHGRVQEHREELARLENDSAFVSAYTNWIAAANLNSLAQWWCKGLNIDWQSLPEYRQPPRRMSLPGYPFARERYWHEQPVVMDEAGTNTLHPLVHANTSNLAEQRYTSRFHGAELFLEKDETGKGKQLPALLALEMIRAALALAAPERKSDGFWDLHGVVWAEAMAVAADQSLNISLLPHGRARIDVEIFTESIDQEQRDAPMNSVCCQTQAMFQSFCKEPRKDLDQIRRSLPEWPGPIPAGVIQLHGNEQQLLAQWRISQGDSGTTNSEYGIHPQLLGTVTELLHLLHTGQSQPLSLDRCRVVRRCPDHGLLWVRLTGHGRSDVDIVDLDGHVCVQMQGLHVEGSVSPGQASMQNAAASKKAWPPTPMEDEKTAAALLSAEKTVTPSREILLVDSVAHVPCSDFGPVSAKPSSVELLPPRGISSAPLVRKPCIILPDFSPALTKFPGMEIGMPPVRLFDQGNGVWRIVMDDQPLIALITPLLRAISRVREEPQAKVLLLAGAGTLCWQGGRDACNAAVRHALFTTLIELPVPVIAVLTGDASGAGLLLAAACDFMVCSETGRYWLTDPDTGLLPTSAERDFFEERLGKVMADHLLYWSPPCSGRELSSKGWACHVVSAEATAKSAEELGKDLAEKSRIALELLKAHLNRRLVALLAVLTEGEPVDCEQEEPETSADQPCPSLLVARLESDASAGMEAVLGQLGSLVKQVESNRQYRALVLTSAVQGFLPEIEQDQEKAALYRLAALLRRCPVPVIAGFESGASGLAWLFGLFCDGMVYQNDGQFTASALWIEPDLAPEVATLCQQRLGQSLAQEILFGQDGMSGTALLARQGSLVVRKMEDVLPAALKLARCWSRWPRPLVEAWKREQLSHRDTMVHSLPAAPVRSGAAVGGIGVSPLPLPQSLALGSLAVVATLSPEGVLLVRMEERADKNMFSDTLIKGLREVFAFVAQSPACKAVVLTGYDNYFATGGTRETLLAIQEGRAKFTDETVFQLPLECPVPVIAAIQGHAIGGGWSFAMFADLVLLSAESRYLSPYMSYGFTPGAGSTLILPGKIGWDLGRETLLSAREFSGQMLQERGIGFPVVPRREVVDAAMELGRQIARQPRELLIGLKQVLTHEIRSMLADTCQRELGMHEQTFVDNAETLARIRSAFSLQSPSVTRQAVQESSSSSAVLAKLKSMLAEELFLDPEEIGEDTPFIDLGLDSITGVTWIRKINSTYGINIEATKVYSHPTLQAIGRLVASAAGTRGADERVDTATANAVRQETKAAITPPPTNTDREGQKNEQSLAAIIATLKEMLARELHLEPEEIGEDTPFIDLGLDSITGVTWVRKINERYGMGIAATRVYSHPSLNEIGRLVWQEAAQVEVASTPEPHASVSPLTTMVSAQSAAPIRTIRRQPLASWRQQGQGRRISWHETDLQPGPIAIIGAAGQFPRAANLAAFWHNIATGAQCVTEVSAQRWRLADYYQPGRPVPGKTNCKWFGAVAGHDLFDPLFFNISPTEAECMEPQQRLFLQVCYHGIENAGYSPQSFAGSQCGVFVGCGPSDYHGQSRQHQLSAQGFTGAATSILAARIAYFLDLHGPCLSIDTACSSSLVAVAEACDSLNTRHSDVALAGGVYIMAGPDMHIMTSQAGMLSTDGRCFAFDDRANGFVPGEGVGVVVLKRLQDAERDQDRILAVIEGWGVNQDGRTNGITAPNEVSQTKLLQTVYRKFGIDPDEIQLVEAHGTGTKLGDPIEVAGLKAAFAPFTKRKGYCALGSVKSNIGHCLSAAGAAGLIKLILAIQHQALPPTINFERINEHIQLKDSPFFINGQLQSWHTTDGKPRRAAISAFGFSGTNAHLVLREHALQPRSALPVEVLSEEGRVIVPLSARTESQLRQKVHDLLIFLRENAHVNLLELAYTLQLGRDAMGERLGVLAASVQELVTGLEDFLAGKAETSTLYYGQIKQHQQGMQLISQDEEMQTTIINAWLEQKRLGKLLALWVKGLELDWALLYGEVKPQRIALPLYPFAQNRYWLNSTQPVPGMAQPIAEPASQPFGGLPGETHHTAHDVSYVPTWEPQPLPMGQQAPTGHKSVLIVQTAPCFGLEQTIFDHYAQETENQTWLIQLGETTKFLHNNTWSCGINDAEGLAHCLQQAHSFDALFFLACSQEPVEPASAEQVRRSQEYNEIQLLRLVKWLKREHKIRGHIDTYVVTFDNHSIDQTPTRFWGAGAAGLAYSLAQGNHQFRVRNLDLASVDVDGVSDRSLLINAILREPPSDRGEVCKLHQGRRYSQSFVPLVWPDDDTSALKEHGVYLIAGGSGIVGRIITRHLLSAYQARVIWVGRSAADSAKMQDLLHAFAEFGDRLQYVQTDVTDADALQKTIARVKARYVRLHGAIFSGMVFGTENSIDQTSEDEFRRILQVKTLGIQTFFAVLRNEPLDFLCSFSSGQAYSFSGAAKLSAYATGITFADSFVRSARSFCAFPVGILNWGFWQAAVRERIEQLEGVSTKSIEALEDALGIDCFERFIATLRQEGGLRQLLCMRASHGVESLMHCNRDEVATPVPGSSPVPVSLVEAAIEIPGQRIAEHVRQQEHSELDHWLARLLGCQLGRLAGGTDRLHLPQSMDTVRRQSGIVDKFVPWFDQSMRMLAQRGQVKVDGDMLLSWQIPDWQETWHAWQNKKSVFTRDKDMGPLAVLVDECSGKLPEILQGRRLATDVLFPRSSLGKVADLYRNNAVADIFNEMVAATVVAYVQQRQQAQPEVRLRILEVGAGTGGTSAAIFSRLKPYRQVIAEYCYSDLSKAFFFHAEQKYLADSPYIVCRRLDIEQPIEEQCLDVGSYDLVIAANALHATKDIRRTLRHAKAALQCGGFLIISEICAASLSTHLTFGLLDGWWLFEDEELRIPGCPGLYPATWRRVLAEEGFSTVLMPGTEAQPLGNQVVVAQSDGLIRLRTGSIKRGQAQAAVTGERHGKRAVQPQAVVRQHTRPAQDLPSYVRAGVLAALSATLKIAANDIAVDTAFSEYGVDSILGVNFVDQLNERFVLSLNTAIIFEFSSVERLCQHLVEMHAEAIEHSRGEIGSGSIPVADSLASASSGTPQDKGPLQLKPFAQVHAPSGVEEVEIAIVGMAGKMPKAESVGEFWENLLAGVDGVEELPPHYLDQVRCFSPVKQQGKTRCKWGGILAERDCFDPLFFNISPKEAEAMNPHQRLVMQESWNALEDAGYNAKALAGSNTAIFIGAEPAGYVGETFTGLSDAIIASRFSYAMDFNGAAFVVNTGCSSSAVAIHLACESLRHRESNLVLAGGVNACLHQDVLIRLDQIEMLSPSGRCFTFDQRGDGTIISEGIGMVVLKRLDDALASGDHIYGVLCASGMNQDGASNGITAPNGVAQEQLITEVYQRFGINPRRISYVEAHGTGTRLGDPVETNALVRAYTKYSKDIGWCAVGSAKSHIGHTGAAAGVIGLIKVLLSMQHEMLPRLLNFQQRNPLIQFDNSPFFITREPVAWPASSGTPRMAAINSFGHSGTNVHLVVREHSSLPSPRPGQSSLAGPVAIPLSARTEEQLHQRCEQLLAFLQATPEHPDLLSLSQTLQVGRVPMEERLGFVVDSIDQLISTLQNFLAGEEDSKVFRSRLQADAKGPWQPETTAGELLRQWTRGHSVEWQVLWHGASQPQRMSLPCYPFAKERYWQSSAFNPVTPQGEGMDAVAEAALEDVISRIADNTLASEQGIHLLKMMV